MDDQEVLHPSTILKIEPERLNSLNKASCVTNVEHERRKKRGCCKQNTKNLQAKRSVDHKGPQGKIIKGHWSHEEDRSLIELVKRYGVKNWTEIARKLSGRVGKQCRDRWENHLRPDIKKGGWSEEEENQLIELHRQLGSKWSEIARRLPSRTENTIKNHWYATKRKQNSSKTKHDNNLLYNYITSVSRSSSSSHEYHNDVEESLHSNDVTSEELENIPKTRLDINAIPEGDQDERPYIPGMVIDREGNLEVEYHDQDHDPSHDHSSTSLAFDEKKEMDFFEMLFDQDFH